MKKIILLSFLLAGIMISCKKKKDDPTISSTPNVAPTVSITSPDNNGSSSSQPTDISATATDSDGTISKVQFYDGTTLLGEDQTSPYSITVTLQPGNHTLTAKAYDNSNASTTSASVNYSIVQPDVPMTPAVAN